MITETLTRKPVAEPPDSETTVMLFDPSASEPVWPGYLDGDTLAHGRRHAGGADVMGRDARRAQSMSALLLGLALSRKKLSKVTVLTNQLAPVMFSSTQSNSRASEVALRYHTAYTCINAALDRSELDCARKCAVFVFQHRAGEAVIAFSKCLGNTHFDCPSRDVTWIASDNPIIPDFRFTYERCQGTGYITTALGKLPCPTCSASEVSNRHNHSEIVNIYQKTPTELEDQAREQPCRLALVDKVTVRREKSASLANGGPFGIGPRNHWITNFSAKVNFPASGNDKSCAPFSSVWTFCDYERLSRDSKFLVFGYADHGERSLNDLMPIPSSD